MKKLIEWTEWGFLGFGILGLIGSYAHWEVFSMNDVMAFCGFGFCAVLMAIRRGAK